MSKKDLIKDIDDSFDRVANLIVNNKYDSATKIINKLYDNSTKIGYTNGVTQYYDSFILILFFTHKNHLALTFLKHSIKIHKKSDDKRKLIQLYNIQGLILSRLNDFPTSYYYLKKALGFAKELEPKNEILISNTYLNLSSNALNQNYFEKALNYNEICFNHLKNNEKTNTYFRLFVNASLSKVRLLLLSKELKKAKQFLNKFLAMNIDLTKREKINLEEITLQFLLKNPKNDKSIFTKRLQKLLKSALEIEDKALVIRILYVLKYFHSKEKDFELAYKYSNQLLKVKEKIEFERMNILDVQSLRITKEEKSSDFEIYHKSELEIAAQYQSNFFKTSISEKLKLDVLFTPSKTLSGDFLGTFNLSNEDNHYLFVLADVVGKGITASYISFMLDGIIKSIIFNAVSFNLKNIINDINTILSDALMGLGFVSLWAGILDVDNNKLESVNAGHLPTYLISKEGKITELNQGSTILGMFDKLPDFKSETVVFEKGDSIIAYSDGITEAMNSSGDLFENDFKRIVDNYAKKKDFNFIKLLEAQLKLYQDKSQIQDDISCLLVEFKN